MERVGNTFHLTYVTVPPAGLWTLRVRNHGSEKPTQYTLSTAVHSDLTLSVEGSSMSQGKLNLIARLRHPNKSLDDAAIIAHVTLPTRSQQQMLAAYAGQLGDVKLPETVDEKGLSEEQRLLTKLAVFAMQFRGKPGGIFECNSLEVKLEPQGNGIFAAEVPLSAPGNVTVKVTGRGMIDGQLWQRVAMQAVYVPEKTVTPPKLRIADIFVRSNKLWKYLIVGVRVRKNDDTVATPDDGVSVDATVAQGRKHVDSGPLPFHSAGGYYMWRLARKGLRSGPAEITARARVAGAAGPRAIRAARAISLLGIPGSGAVHGPRPAIFAAGFRSGSGRVPG